MSLSWSSSLKRPAFDGFFLTQINAHTGSSSSELHNTAFKSPGFLVPVLTPHVPGAGGSHLWRREQPANVFLLLVFFFPTGRVSWSLFRISPSGIDPFFVVIQSLDDHAFFG